MKKSKLIFCAIIITANMILSYGCKKSSDNTTPAPTATTNIPWQQTSGPGNCTIATNGSNIFAGNPQTGALLSTDNGSTWSAINNGLTFGFNGVRFAFNGSNIYASTNGGIYLSTDNGSNWSALNTSGLPASSFAYSIAVSGSYIFAGINNSGTGIGGGVYLSSNNGGNWTAVNTGLPNNSGVYTLSIIGSNIFAGVSGSGGLFLSTNNGGSWTNIGLSTYTAYSIIMSGSTIFVGAGTAGIFKSTDNGNSWTLSFDGTGQGIWVESLAISGAKIFAGGAGGGVIESLDGGSTWSFVNTGLTETSVCSVAISGTTVFTGTQLHIWKRAL